jgi:hypothetical protein
MKKLYSIALALLFYMGATAQLFGPNHHIIIYSTHPVDTTVARPHNNATALVRSSGDTIIAYINRAKYSIDIAVFDFVEDSTWFEGGYVPPIHKAINNAYARGVKIRYIYNDSVGGYTPNTGLDSINPYIHTLPNPSYSGIMHNKFFVIDGRSSNPNDPIVWTGCMNWEPGQIDKDINNLVIFQDSALAHCYLTEFNQMWGDTVEGGAPDTVTSLFGYKKKDIMLHNFYVDGHRIEAWFSPEDTVSNHIVETEGLAKSEIDFEEYEYTYEPDADPLVTAYNHGITLRGIVDQSSLGYSPYTTLSNYMGANLQIYAGLPGYDYNSICHSKYMIVDPCDYSADPMVLTGSHNWSESANFDNNENTIIIHDSSVANQFYQAFHADFLIVTGGTNLTQACISYPLGISKATNIDMVTYYPNPATNTLKVTLNIPGNNVQYTIYGISGQAVLCGKLNAIYVNTIDINTLSSGMYLLRVQNNNEEFTAKFIKQ